MKLAASMVFVSDIENARDFYVNKLGLAVKADRPDIAAIFFDTGATTLGVHVPSEKNRSKAQIGRSTGIIFMVPSVEQVVKDLGAKGVTFTSTTGPAPERPDKATFVDQDGNEFGLADKDPW